MIKKTALFLIGLNFICLPLFADQFIVNGNKLVAEKKYQQAVAEYQKALKNDPKSMPINLMLGLTYARMGSWDEALKYTKTAAELKPDYTPLYNLGLIYGARNETQKSIQAFDKAIAVNPKSAVAHYQKGLVYSNAESWEEAAKSYQRALALNPYLDEARIGLIGAYLKQDLRNDAMKQIDEFKQMNKKDIAKALEHRMETQNS